MLRGFKHTLYTPGPRDLRETETELCLSVSCRGPGQQWTAAEAGALGAADLGVAEALLEEVTINPTIEPPELTQYWGNRLLEGKNKILYTHKDPGERSSDYKRDLPMSVQEYSVEAWVGGDLLQGWGHSVKQCVHGTF